MDKGRKKPPTKAQQDYAETMAWVAEQKKLRRPTKLTKALTEKFCEHIRLGLPIMDACALCEISQPTYYDWVTRSETGEEPFANFLREIKKAQADFKTTWLDVISRTAKGDKELNWFPAAWLLERRDRANFGKNDPNKPEVIVKIDPQALTDALKAVESEGD